VIIIRVELEEPVRVGCVWLREGDELRLLDWLAGNPRLAALVMRAIELERDSEERAA
jgi:hypothetical protein